MTEYALRLSDSEIARYRFMAAIARQDEAELWRRAGIDAGARVADVGCGPGAMLEVLAESVGPSGSVVGVDGDPAAVGTAQALTAAKGHEHASAHLGRADATGLEPGSVDVAVMRHVLAHNGGAEQRIVDHLATLPRPGGAVYLVDADLPALSIDPEPRGLGDLRDAYLEFLRSRGTDVRIGTRLGRLLRTAGLAVEEFRGWFSIISMPKGIRPPSWAARHSMLAAGLITERDVKRWERAFVELDAEEDRPQMFAALFASIGRRAA